MENNIKIVDGVEMKQCVGGKISCGEWKPLTEFYFRKEMSSYKKQCNECIQKQAVVLSVGSQKCIGKCGLIKPMTEFYFRKDVGQYKTECKECVKNRSENRYENKKEEIIEKGKIYREENKDHIKIQKHQYYNNNKEIISEKGKVKYVFNKENIKIYSKEYYNKNKEIIKQKEKEKRPQRLIKEKEYWSRPENKSRRNKNAAASRKRRMEKDPAFKLGIYISNTIRATIAENGNSKKGAKTFKYLPYTKEELKAHIESQFEWWMTWDNWGVYNSKTYKDNDPATWTWQIDHIIPQSDLPYTSMEDKNCQKCWALSNLRPLNSKQNQLDGVTRIRHSKKENQ